MTNLFFTKDAQWLERWDDFLMKNPKGHYNQLSEWLQSYSVYGFDYTLLLLTENDEIVGGCGIVVAKFYFFKFVIVPAGPILNDSFENSIEKFFEEIKLFSNQIKACYLQINIPLLANELQSKYTIQNIKSDSFYFTGLKGVQFKYVISVNGFRFVNLSDKNPQKHYNSNTSRNIAKAFKSNLEFSFAKSGKEIEEAYRLIENNAQTQGYSVRNYASFKNTLNALIEKNQDLFAVCRYEDKIIGCLFLIDCGNRYTYISGGTDRNYSDLKIGHFLHQNLIELSLAKGYQVYDISVGGSDGVLRFKKGFGGKHYEFIGARYWILKPSLFKSFLFLERYLKPHKAKIALLLSKLKNTKK